MREVWPDVRLGDISSVNYGYTAKASFESVGPKFLRITDIKKHGVDWSTVPSCLIDDGDFERHKLQHDDIVFARTGATTGKSYRLDNPKNSVAASYLIRLRIRDKSVLPSFVSLFFQTKKYWDAVTEGTIGSAQGGFNASKLGELVISKPPIPEQKRIVAILNEAFEGIDAAIANTQKNLANARELYDSYLNDVFTKKGEGWVEKKLVQCVSSISTGPFGSMLHKSDYIDGGIPIVNPINIIDDRIEANYNKTVSEKTIKNLNTYILDVDDIVIGRRGEIGRCAVVQADQAGWLCGTGCFYIKPSKDLDPNFLVNLLRSSKYREELEKVATGATMKNLSNTSLKNMVIAFPTNPEEQYKFLSLFDELSATTKNLETIYQQKLDSLNELKQSILAKAFSGELTAQPDQVLKEAVG